MFAKNRTSFRWINTANIESNFKGLPSIFRVYTTLKNQGSHLEELFNICKVVESHLKWKARKKQMYFIKGVTTMPYIRNRMKHTENH